MSLYRHCSLKIMRCQCSQLTGVEAEERGQRDFFGTESATTDTKNGGKIRKKKRAYKLNVGGNKNKHVLFISRQVMCELAHIAV